MQTIVLGNPENRRVSFFQEALQRAKLPAAKILSYEAWLKGELRLSQIASKGDVLRIESPGENFWVEKKMLALGYNPETLGEAAQMTPEKALDLSYDLGRILCPKQWYLGFCEVLQKIEEERTGLGLQVMNHPEEIAIMFHKPLCHQRFIEAKVPVAQSLGVIEDYEMLREVMKQREISKVFVKLSYGSSASGVIAYRCDGDDEEAITSAELVRERGEVRLYNSLRIRRYTQTKDLESVINFILREGAIVEEWLPKAVFQGKQFDLRVVVIAGKAKHFVVRLGKSPMTNLHLGNARGDAALFRRTISDKDWQELCQTCEDAFAAFPKGLYAGVDVLLSPDFKEKTIVEINAFGDLLPNVLCDGLDTYEAEIKVLNLVKAEHGGSARR
jgi:glutathione synthase/RimK-type ligase-like ATP-grasp enzyme